MFQFYNLMVEYNSPGLSVEVEVDGWDAEFDECVWPAIFSLQTQSQKYNRLSSLSQVSFWPEQLSGGGDITSPPYKQSWRCHACNDVRTVNKTSNQAPSMILSLFLSK